ncbi:MAG: hypothetical protein O2931_01530 [Planctomycetota bacterium]|nr:hypothetical protein [Planctomycetota bacterium]MDA1177454.1 hypothetical protein [Planctomycetota bacterium]
MNQPKLPSLRYRLSDLKGELDRLQRHVEQLETGLDDLERQPSHRDFPAPHPNATKSDRPQPAKSSPGGPDRPKKHLPSPQKVSTPPGFKSAEESTGQTIRIQLNRLTQSRRSNQRRRSRLVVPWLVAAAQYVKRRWSEKSNKSWVVSIMLHASILVILACWTITSRGELNPVNLLLQAAHSEPLELAVVEFATIEQPQLPEIPVPEEAVPPEVDLTKVFSADAEILDSNWVEELTPTVPVPLESPIASPAKTSTDNDAASPPPRAVDRDSERRRRESRMRRKKGLSVEFFGTRSTSQRVVYLVDNSNSMHSGRFETALAELHRSVMALSTDQSFYVIFYSDTAYGLFHPATAADLIPATRDNKQRFSSWLSTVEMCTGGQLLKAFEFAEKLGPDTVYLLSDGVIQSEKAMAHILQSERRTFILNAVGLTVPDPLSGRRLQAIAESNGGSLQLVGIHPAARLAAQQNPIRRNRTRGSVWGIQLPTR